jgi:endothelin-converting enzyme/putative endopeptidase
LPKVPPAGYFPPMHTPPFAHVPAALAAPGRLALLPLVAALALACKPAPPPAPVPEPAKPVELPAYAQAVLRDMDAKADPCADFYQYACGGWTANTKLPADKSRWTRSFSTITEENDNFIKALLEKAAANPGGGDADWKRMGDAYGACMDEAAVEAAGTKALDPLFSAIDGAKTLPELVKVIGQLQRHGVDVFWGGGVDGDFADPGLQVLHLSQTGLGLPDRDYYMPKPEDTKGKELLAAYPLHIQKIFELAGKGGKAEADKALKVEMELAKLHKPRAELRDPTKTYNKLDRGGLKKLAPEIDWDAWLTASHGAHVQDINVEVPEVYDALGQYMKKAKLDELKAYMKWAVLRDTASHLPNAIVEADFAFFGKQLQGQAELSPRWKRCVRATNSKLGEVVGRFYVQERFGGASKDVARTMIGDIQGAFEQGLPSLAWMDETTRKRATDKKNTLVFKIGYPDKWEDYSSLSVQRGDHLANLLAANAFAHDDQIALASKPTDRSRWFMPPQLVNAYYHPLLNEMAFPAGILQPPFFDASYPSAMNYGAIGMVIGHELTHGFDDQGSQFDPQGKLSDWWSADARARFEERTACVSSAYGQYEPVPGTKINGDLTLGENIADIGGLRVAYRAWKARRGQEPNQAPSVPGLSEDQLFFVAFAQGWCTLSTAEATKEQLLSDPHSPGQYRVIGTATQLPEFAAAFSCPAGAAMAPAKTCEVW